MKHALLFRMTALTALITIVLLSGCGKNRQQPAAATPEPTSQIVLLDDDDTPATDTAAHTGIYCVDATEDVTSGGAYASLVANENTVLVENGGLLTMSGADVNKLGDATSSFSSGQNAAIAATTGGQCTFDGCVVTSNAVGGFGLYVSGQETTLTAATCQIFTSAASSAGLCLADGGTLTLTGGAVSTEGERSPSILSSGDTSATLSGVSFQTAGSALIEVLSGTLRLHASAQTLTGVVSLDEAARLDLILTNGSVFTGILGEDTPARASISLDETSVWNLTGETYVSSFADADATLGNIVSNGFSIYYDSNLPENAVWGGQSFALAGGGFLAPII